MSKIFQLKGQDVKMYTVGELADALGRSAQTVRKWEAEGIIPPTRFRSKTNTRLYPEAIVVGMKKIVDEEGIKQGQSFGINKFKERVAKLFMEVNQTLLN